MSEQNSNSCPLCESKQTHLFYQDKKRSYFRCLLCLLVYVPSKYQLNCTQEKAEYDKHQNDPQDTGYRKFLNRAVKPLFSQIPKSAQGLDFGCGPGPCISEMAKEREMSQAIKVSNYDPYYFNRPELLEKQYDFITMTEVIEHIAKPKPVLKQLDSMLNTDGILAIMTKRVASQEAFSNWHYKNDPTHICFYSLDTFEWIEQKMSWRLEIIDKDVIFFHKD